MWYEIFQIPSDDPRPATERLNQFLKTHRIVKVEKQFFTDGTNAYWSFCVSWLEGESETQTGKRETRVDYQKVLTEEQFRVYSALRELRKQLAENSDIPIYAVATNDQLSEMVKQRADSVTTLQKISGFGKIKAERYGEQFVELLRERLGNPTVETPPTD